MRFMTSQTTEELEPTVKELQKHKEDSRYEKIISEAYYFGILQYAIYSTDHEQIDQIKKIYEKQGYDFNKYFSSAERQLNKIEDPETTLKPFINSLNTIIKSF